MSDKDKLQRMHNRGEQDASEGNLSLPNDPLRMGFAAFFASAEQQTEWEEENKAYLEGREHTESQNGSCFLTTACVEHAGLADDCHELVVLRSFRDNYIANLAHGPALLTEYYKVAPVLVRQIKQDQNCDAELASIFSTVTRAVALVEQRNYSEALLCYETMFTELKGKFFPV